MATIPTYKKTMKIALSCCRAADCGKLVDGKCTAHTKEECAIERILTSLERVKLPVWKNGEVVKYMSGMTYIKKHREDIGIRTFKPYTLELVVYRLKHRLEAFQREAVAIAKRNLFWYNHKKTRVWEHSAADKYEIRIERYKRNMCEMCDNKFEGKCLKYSDKEVCVAEERCKKYGLAVTKENVHKAYWNEIQEEEHRLWEMNHSSNVEDFYASSSLRGGWCGD